MVYLSWYLLQMRTFGKVASLIGSVEETRLVDTVEVVNCSTVLVRGVFNGILVTFEEDLLQRKIASKAMVRMASTQKIFTVVEERGIWGHPCRLVLSQKSDNLLILKKAPKTKPGFGWRGLRALNQQSPSRNCSLATDHQLCSSNMIQC